MKEDVRACMRADMSRGRFLEAEERDAQTKTKGCFCPVRLLAHLSACLPACLPVCTVLSACTSVCPLACMIMVHGRPGGCT